MARIVLVHGAFAGAWCWEPVLPGLRAAGHEVEAIDLPGSGEDPTPVSEVSLDAYAERVCGVLARGRPAVLVGHSMGGMVVTQAAARCPEHVAALVYVAAFLPGDGQSLMDLVSLPEAADDQVQANLVRQRRTAGGDAASRRSADRTLRLLRRGAAGVGGGPPRRTARGPVRGPRLARRRRRGGVRGAVPGVHHVHPGSGDPAADAAPDVRRGRL